MGNYLVEKFKESFAKNYQAAQKQRTLFAELYTMVEVFEENKEVREEVKNKLNELFALVTYEAGENIMNMDAQVLEAKNELLAKYQAADVTEVLADVVGQINEQYNRKITDEAQWLDLKVQLLRYKALHKKELRKLADLESTVKHCGADTLLAELQNKRESLIRENNVLEIIVEKLEPEQYRARGERDSYPADYEKTKTLIQKHVSLFSEKGRIELLGAYQRFLKDYDDSSVMKQMWITAAEQYCQKRRSLQEHTEMAQKQREKTKAPEQDTLRQEEFTKTR